MFARTACISLSSLRCSHKRACRPPYRPKSSLKGQTSSRHKHKKLTENEGSCKSSVSLLTQLDAAEAPNLNSFKL